MPFPDDPALLVDSMPVVMGIINVTPDSFWAGSRRPDVSAAVETARGMAEAGAAIIDVGGESTRPGAEPVSQDEEVSRVVPLVRALAEGAGLVVSVDTRNPVVAGAALEAGARIINDVGGMANPDMRSLASASQATAIIMHMQGEPGTMQDAPRYQDVCAEVDAFFARQIELCLASGIRRERIWLDPGIGFGKRLEDNLALIAGLARFTRHGCPLVLGISRKSFIGAVTGHPVDKRLLGTCLYHMACLTGGAGVLRVHDVPEAVETITVWRSLAWRIDGEISQKPAFSP